MAQRTCDADAAPPPSKKAKKATQRTCDVEAAPLPSKKKRKTAANCAQPTAKKVTQRATSSSTQVAPPASVSAKTKTDAECRQLAETKDAKAEARLLADRSYFSLKELLDFSTLAKRNTNFTFSSWNQIL